MTHKKLETFIYSSGLTVSECMSSCYDLLLSEENDLEDYGDIEPDSLPRVKLPNILLSESDREVLEKSLSEICLFCMDEEKEVFIDLAVSMLDVTMCNNSIENHDPKKVITSAEIAMDDFWETLSDDLGETSRLPIGHFGDKIVFI